MEKKIIEDGGGAPAASAPAPLSSPGSVPGMGAPSLPGRGFNGSGDVPNIAASKKKKKKKVLNYSEFLSNVFNEK